MRRAGTAAAAVLGVGVLLFVVLLLVDRSDRAFSLGAGPSGVAAQVEPGQQACQGPIAVPDGAAFNAVRIPLGTYGKPGPPLQVTVRDGRGRTVASSTVSGYRDGSTLDVPVDRSLSGSGYTVCFRNRGRTDVGLYGTGGNPLPASGLRIDGGDDTNTDLALSFGRDPRSLLAGVPSLLDRAVLFRSPRLPAALYGVVLALLLAGAGWGLVAALRSAEPSVATEPGSTEDDLPDDGSAGDGDEPTHEDERVPADDEHPHTGASGPAEPAADADDAPPADRG